MTFKCQQDSFLKEHLGKVVSCEAVTAGNNQIYQVILDETIFFPEGGGQPCDYGTINNKPVRKVERIGSQAVHFVESSEPFTVEEEVVQIIDWERRFDHMQQHSGQHLITALFDQTYGFDTKSWWLGKETSYIELNAQDVSTEQLNRIEKMANELIIEGREVTVEQTSMAEGLKFQDIRAPRGLPPDHEGSVRIITIHGVESNMCCGTHVSNLSQLQAVKLLNVEKTKNKLFVHFLVGNRIIKKLEDCYSRELQLNLQLKGGPSNHAELIQKMQTNMKSMQRSLQVLLKEAALLEAEKLKAITPLPAYHSCHRRDGAGLDFINNFLRHAPSKIFYFLTACDASGKGGYMVLHGEASLVYKIGPVFAKILNGKGSGKDGYFQAKINDINKLSECEAKLKENFD